MCKECNEVKHICNGDKMFYELFDELTDDLKDKYKGSKNKRSKDAYVKFINFINKKEYILLSNYYGATKKVCVDFQCGHEPHLITSDDCKQGKGCPKCGKRKIGDKAKARAVKKRGCIADTHPHLIPFFVNIEDTYNYTIGSNEKVKMQCPLCGTVKKQKVGIDHFARTFNICCDNEECENSSSGKLITRWQDEEYKKRLGEKQHNAWEQDTTRKEKQIQRLKEEWQDEEKRDARISHMTSAWTDEMKKERSESMSGEKNPMYGKRGMRGSEHPLWKGGEKSINSYLRNLPCIKTWKAMAREQVDYTCQLSGLKSSQLKHGELPVHHLYAFTSIVEDAHDFYNIEFKETYGEYTEEELKLLEDYVSEWHKDTSNAVVLCKQVHRLFHDVFMGGCKNPTTKEDFEEFKERYLNGEFDSKEEVA